MEYTVVRNLIAGNRVDGDTGDSAPLYNPSTGERIGGGPFSSAESSTAAAAGSRPVRSCVAS